MSERAPATREELVEVMMAWLRSYSGMKVSRFDAVSGIAALERAGVRLVQDGGWQPIDTAPRDGKSIWLYTTCHGQVEARFCAGEWHTGLEGQEYDGPVWVCADDAFQIEVEEWPGGELLHGTATHWRPLPPPPEAAP